MYLVVPVHLSFTRAGMRYGATVRRERESRRVVRAGGSASPTTAPTTAFPWTTLSSKGRGYNSEGRTTQWPQHTSPSKRMPPSRRSGCVADRRVGVCGGARGHHLTCNRGGIAVSTAAQEGRTSGRPCCRPQLRGLSNVLERQGAQGGGCTTGCTTSRYIIARDKKRHALGGKSGRGPNGREGGRGRRQVSAHGLPRALSARIFHF